MRAIVLRPIVSAVLFGALLFTSSASSAFAQSAEDTEPPASENVTPTDADLQPSSFQEITPGESAASDVREQLGEPIETMTVDGQVLLVYKVGPFPRVEFTIDQGTVVSIVIHLEKKLSPKEVVEQLSLTDFHSVLVLDDDEEPLGEAYPERGVLLSFAPGTRAVAQVILEPISTDAIELRLTNRDAADIAGQLSDIALLLKERPNSGELYWQRANVLLRVSEFQQAAEALKHSLTSSPDDPRFILTSAELLMAEGESEKAGKLVERLLDDSPPALIQAQTQRLLGKATASGGTPDYKEAIRLQTSAIKLATPFASSEVIAERRTALRTLTEASLDVADSIARGNWASKKEVVPKWLRSAEVLAMRAIKHGDAGKVLRLHVWRRTLEIYQTMGAYDEALTVLDAAHKGGTQLVASETDPYHQQLARRETLRSLFAAVRLEQARDNHTRTLKHANAAIELLDELDNDVKKNALDAYLAGRLFYYVGAIYAVHHKDHAEAVRWYERSLPHLSRELPTSELRDLGVHGERFVSMGVSYWESGVRKEGVELTEKGLEAMQRATRMKLIPEGSLAVPFDNLAAMLRKQGREDEARDYAQQAARLPVDDDNAKR